MKRSSLSLAFALAATLAVASAASAQPISEPASCQGYLASWANPNNAYPIHTIIKPLAEDLGVPQGAIVSDMAQLHEGNLEACIP